ncbi:MAG: hypothetical protein Q8N18_13995 [Opitutaceae bacterium]|nr:hypothetical protein [Opitutaceae bacterium]
MKSLHLTRVTQAPIVPFYSFYASLIATRRSAASLGRPAHKTNKRSRPSDGSGSVVRTVVAL